MSVRAHYALYRRTAAEKNFPAEEWRDTGLRGDSESEVRAKWGRLPESERSWQETSVRLVPVADVPERASDHARLDAARVAAGIRDRLEREP